MAKEITMPKLSDTMTEGLFAGWRKNIGDRIERGDIIAEVETDKAVMELEAFASGVLLKTMASGGELVPVGAVLGLIGEPGELAATAGAAAAKEPEAAPAASSPAAPADPAPPPAAPPAPVAPTPPAELHNEQEHSKASPLVRRLARDQGIDLGQVQGSGPEGRITQEDLTGFTAQSHQLNTEPAPTGSSASETPRPLSSQPSPQPPAGSMRQAIATTVTRSWQTIPHFNATVEVDMDVCREVVRELKNSTHPLGYNALLIKACAALLQRFPLLRAGGADAEDGIHIGIAVELPDGLLMPVIRQCERLSVAEIERERVAVVAKCREGRLSSAEMSGGCFSISNLGMYGVDDFNALIVPGQTAILAVGAVRERPTVRDGMLAVAATMRITLSSDHRFIDGAYAARFLAELRQALEKPASLLV